jgi:anti-sigma factor RsiW
MSERISRNKSDSISNSDIDARQAERQAEMDSLLRRSLAAPVPRLSPDFHQNLSRALRRWSQPLNQSGRTLLAGYGALSGAVSVVVMRSQGLGWVAIAVMTIAPLATLELVRRLRRRQWGMAAK